MAIQLPNPGLGDGQTGDNEFVMWTKVKNNFNNNSHAASRMVGTDEGNVMQVGAFGWGTTSAPKITDSSSDIDILESLYAMGSHVTRLETASTLMFRYGPTLFLSTGPALAGLSFSNSNDGNIKMFGGTTHDMEGIVSHTIYTSGNTTTDSNKNIKTSSPVVRVFSDHLDKIHQANDLPIKYTRNGVGDYTIEGTTGLRENDWQIVIPKDDHDNQVIAFTIEDDNGAIRLKTYKRTFSMETFMFGPDLDTSLDIPEGRWVDLHFNDLPDEDDTQTEV